MPGSNPLVELNPAAGGEARYSTLSAQQALGGTPNVEAVQAVNAYGSAQAQNAAGTSENVALHVALIVAFALVGVYVMRQSGFKFVVAGSVG